MTHPEWLLSRLPYRVVLFAFMMGSAAFADDAASLLASKGLVSFGQYYVLPMDAKLNDRLQKISKAQAEWDALSRRRVAAFSEVEQAETLISKLYRQEGIVILDGPGVPAANSPRTNQKTARASQAKPYEDDLATSLTALRHGPALEAPSSLILSLAADMDAAAEQYATLAMDPAITAAIAGNKSGGARRTLGPSSRFSEVFQRVRNQRERIRNASVSGKSASNSSGLNVDAIFDGKTHVTMRVDPSAPFVLLSSDASRQTGFISNPDDRVYVLTADGSPIKAERGTIKSLTVGPLTAHDVAAAVMPERTASAECLLGATFLQKYNWEIDDRLGELRLGPAGASISGDGKTAPATTRASR